MVVPEQLGPSSPKHSSVSLQPQLFLPRHPLIPLTPSNVLSPSLSSPTSPQLPTRSSIMSSVNALSEDDYEDDDGDDKFFETQPLHNPLPSNTVPIVTATPVNALSDDYDDDDDNNTNADNDVQFLTQPPSLVNTAYSSEMKSSPQRRVFLDSILAEAELVTHNYTVTPSPPQIVILDYVSLAIRKELETTWGSLHLCSSLILLIRVFTAFFRPSLSTKNTSHCPILFNMMICSSYYICNSSFHYRQSKVRCH